MSQNHRRPSATMNRIATIIVSFNSERVIRDAVASVPGDSDVIVVDNASRDRTTEIVAETRAQLVPLDRNLGFGTACNRGAAHATGEFLLFLNPDARLAPDALDRLCAAAERYPEAAAFNPRILDEEDKPVLRAPSRFGASDARKHQPASAHSDTPVDVLSGAALFCRRAAFQEVGGFDENIFLFFEDDDLCLAFTDAGHTLMHVHDAIVHHIGGAGSPPSARLTQFKNYHWMRSYQYLSTKRGRQFPIAKTCLRNGLSYAEGFLTGDRDKAMKHLGRLKALWGSPEPSL